MNKFVQFTQNFLNDEEGLTIVEYVIGAALLAAAISTMFAGWGETLKTELDKVFSG